MKHWTLWAIAGLVSACGHSSPPPAAPSPDAGHGARAAVDSTRLSRVADRPADTLTLAEAADAALAPINPDSAADAAILEQLATAKPAAQDSGLEDSGAAEVPGGANAVAAGDVTYDIDVETYGSHARVQYYLDFFQGPARDRFSIWLQRMPRYESMIRTSLRTYGVPEDMVYLALIESGYSNTAVSRARATGMWQFMKGTGKLYGLRIDSWVDERRDPVRATDAAARHLADLRDRFGSMYLAAAAYNAGAGKVGRGLRRLPDEDDEEDENPDATFFRLYDTRFLRRETKDYVPKLIAAALIAKQPEKYGFVRAMGVPPMGYDSIIVTNSTGLDVIARLADTSVAFMRELNPQYLRLVTPPRTAAVVRLPEGTGALVTARYEALAEKDRVNLVEHVVTRGQTVAAIAKLYRVSTSQIGAANPGVRLTRLRTGTHLAIPTSYVPASAGTVEEPLRSGSATLKHRVLPGESLSTIASHYQTSVDRLRALNAMPREDVLKAGQVLRVPAPGRTAATPATTSGARTYLVRRGDTLSGIAGQHHVSLSALRSANGLTSRSVLQAGSRLVIPE
ncbi:MAG: LysM peptidoglycan-binding domain-containing protein [Gemmatimonadales bacterium]